ncbi:MAG: hypothetical protein KC486_07215, partial [Myxococcales bacterium]|nr:hypothetical protein [Myxococcales bacterium]
CAGDKTGGAAADDADATPTATVELRKYSLKTTAPAGTEAKDEVVGDGVMIQGPAIIATVVIADDATPATVDAAQESNAGYAPQNVVVDALADGWALTWDNRGDMGPNYWVQVRREIAGATYWCTSTATRPEQQRNALAACRGLEASG